MQCTECRAGTRGGRGGEDTGSTRHGHQDVRGGLPCKTNTEVRDHCAHATLFHCKGITCTAAGLPAQLGQQNTYRRGTGLHSGRTCAPKAPVFASTHLASSLPTDHVEPDEASSAHMSPDVEVDLDRSSAGTAAEVGYITRVRGIVDNMMHLTACQVKALRELLVPVRMGRPVTVCAFLTQS